MFNQKKNQINKLKEQVLTLTGQKDISNTMLKLAVEELICDDPAGSISYTLYRKTFNRIYRTAKEIIERRTTGC
jgi:hypothetical protein